jgi:hypothetical protein
MKRRKLFNLLDLALDLGATFSGDSFRFLQFREIVQTSHGKKTFPRISRDFL